MNSEIGFSFRADHPSLEQVSGFVDRLISFLSDHALTDRTFLDEFRLAATEATNNSIEHGCVGAAVPFVRFSLSINDSGVCLHVGDPSAFKGWTGKATLPEDPLAEGGRGRFLMEQMTDAIEHVLEPDGHVLVLRKNFARSGWHYEPGQQEKILEAMTEEVGASYEMINALIGLGELVASAGEMSSFLQLALQRVCELTGAQTAYVRMQKKGSLLLVDQAGPCKLDLLASADTDKTGVEWEVFETGQEVTVINGGSFGASDPLRGLVEAAFVAPVFFKSKRLGVLVVAQSGDGPFFTAAQLKVARVVGEYLGIVSAMNELQQQREVEQRAVNQLEIAAEIQLSLMPNNFKMSDRLDIFGVCRPALRAGGDYFDLIALPGGALLVVVADVMGKGLSAALFANMLRTSIRAQIECAADPAQLLGRVNRVLAPDLVRLDMFITVACAWIAPDGSQIKEASAGHPPGLVFKPGQNTITVFESHGFPIGVLPDVEYTNRSLSFSVGDGLILFTDGIPETNAPDGGFFDVGGITAVLESLSSESAEEIVLRMLSCVDKFSDHAPPEDDRTLVALIRRR